MSRHEGEPRPHYNTLRPIAGGSGSDEKMHSRTQLNKASVVAFKAWREMERIEACRDIITSTDLVGRGIRSSWRRR